MVQLHFLHHFPVLKCKVQKVQNAFIGIALCTMALV